MSTPEPTLSPAEAFLSGALPRLRKFFLFLAAVGLVVCLAFFRPAVGAGFAIGALISYLNQRWMERAVELLGERITNQQSKERGDLVVFRALLRYVLIAAGAYVIFRVSLAALYGFLGGVCLPIAAVACEVVVELFVILRSGT